MMRFYQADAKRLLSSRWLTAIVFFVALQTTLLIWLNARQSAENWHAIQFQESAVAAKASVQRSLDAYNQALHSIRQLYAASRQVESQEFHLFVRDLVSQHLANGLLAIGYMAAQPNAAVVKLVEPATPTNQLAIHQEINAHAAIYQDMQKAAASDMLLLSSTAVIPAATKMPVFTLLAPLFVNGAQPARLQGWAFMQLDMASCLLPVLHPLEQQQMQFALRQAAPGGRILYRSALFPNVLTDRSRWQSTVPLHVHGQDWQLRVVAAPALIKSVDYGKANFMGLSGLVVSVLLGVLAHMVASRQRTVEQYQQLNQVLDSSEQRWKFALEGTGDGIWDWQIPENLVTYSEGWCALVGLSKQELTACPHSWQDRIHPDDAPAAMRIIQMILQGQQSSYAIEYRLRCEDDSWKWVYDRAMVFSHDAQGMPQRLIGTLADISHIKQSEEQIWQYANLDMLTNLPNRRWFYTRLEQSFANLHTQQQPLVLMFMDLDRFKEVNDTLGHQQGDGLLKQVAFRLLNCVPESILVGRLGGDEFVLLLNQSDQLDVDAAAQKVLDRLSAPFVLDRMQVYVSASIGIARAPADASSPEELMKCVDQAMYAAKSKGGNSYMYFTRSMQAESERRMQLSVDMRKAILQEQFFLQYQPVVNLHDHSVIKAEALIRWQHPQHGVLGPNEFIGIAEDTLQIIQIGQWVFANAIKQCMAWRTTLDPAFQVTVNKSPVQFASKQPKKYDWLHQLQSQGLDSRMVVVEITERMLMDTDAQVRHRLEEFKQAGVQVALDDFGTGYSALSYLKKFAIDYVKIDRSFVQELANSVADEALCKAIIVMAHSLGLKVVAEGIETRQQLDKLRAMGCDYGQGFYFAPALSSEAFVQWMAQWRQRLPEPIGL